MKLLLSFVILATISSCGPPEPTVCMTDLYECRATYQRERPFSAYTLFKHCERTYGECMALTYGTCEEICRVAYHSQKACEPACTVTRHRNSAQD